MLFTNNGAHQVVQDQDLLVSKISVSLIFKIEIISAISKPKMLNMVDLLFINQLRFVRYPGYLVSIDNVNYFHHYKSGQNNL